MKSRSKPMDMQSALEAFMSANPDLPQGESVKEIEEEMADAKTTSRLDVVLEKKGRAGKQATIVIGFTGSDDQLQSLASKLKRKLGVGGSARGGEILIQGDRRNEVTKLLIEMGYKARII